MRGTVGRFVFAVLCGVAAMVSPEIARADIGVQGPAYVNTGGSPTTSKPQSKLWFNDGFWWASMAVPTSATDSDYHIFKLVGNTWTDTGVVVDTRDSSRQDVLWDGTKLYVASHKFQQTPTFGPTPGDEMRLYRFSYTSGTYTLDADFPVPIDSRRSEALVIDKDSTGMLWATWVQQASSGGPYQVYVSHTTGNCASGAAASCAFTAPIVLAANVTSDDISSLIHFGGNKIGVMWSDQVASAMMFAVHVDGTADTAWSTETAISGPKQADDHINLKADSAGRVFVATKTKFVSLTSLNPQTRLLVRDTSATWSNHTISFSPDRRTRPIVALDEQHGIIHVFETGPHPSGADPENGGNIFESTSSMSNINFAVLSRRPVIQDDDSPGMNNATSTKQNVSATTNLVVLASNNLTRSYWHHFESLASPPPPPGGGGGGCTIRGTSGPDIINGTAARDVICGLGGNDIIRGLGGNDVLRGDRGADRLVGGGGADRLVGGRGNDRLSGGPGPDSLRGGSGRDRLVGSGGRDVFHAGAGRDTLLARDGRRELVDGGGGRDRARVDRRDIRRSIEAPL
jgi:hypothetical protein